MINFLTFTIDISFDGLAFRAGAFSIFYISVLPFKTEHDCVYPVEYFLGKGKEKVLSQLTRSISDGVFVGWGMGKKAGQVWRMEG